MDYKVWVNFEGRAILFRGFVRILFSSNRSGVWRDDLKIRSSYLEIMLETVSQRIFGAERSLTVRVCFNFVPRRI